jgi:HAE1 family hydrophobic/amphiphilic exporter-1
MWYLTKLGMWQRAVTLILAVTLVGVSLWATFQLKRELIPDIELPFRVVFTAYPDASPEDVVEDVTTPIENVIWQRWEGKGLKHTFSTSTDEISIVFAEFEYGTGMKEVSSSIREGIGELELPPAVYRALQMNPQMEENPRVVDVDFSMMPLVMLSLSGDLPPDQLRDIADNQVIPALQDIEGVSSVEAQGGDKEQVLVMPDPERMVEYGISMYRVAALLSFVPGYDSLSDIDNLSMGVDAVVLGDVADVALGPAPRTVSSRTNGENSVVILGFKKPEANTVDVANAVVDKAEEIESNLEGGLELFPVFDQSEFIEESIADLTLMALIGGALAIVIVFVFLAAFRASLVTAMSIPFSILVGFLAMHLTGITINLLTLSAMAIAVGRLIDNSIVVTEVIYRRLKQGERFRDAAINGSREVAGPITSSTLATVAIFIPIMFVGGIVGELFIPFALTITFALIASLLVALIVVPAFSNWFVAKKEKAGEAGVRSGDTWYQRLYIPSLKWALGHRAITLVVVAVLFIGSMGLLPIIGTSFMPGMTEKMLYANIEMPVGTDVGTTDRIAREVEALLVGNNEIETYHSSIGASASSIYGAMAAAMGGGDHTGEITISLAPGANMEKERDALELKTREISDRYKKAMGMEQLEGDLITVMTSETAMSTQMGFAGIELNIQGKSYEDLAKAEAMLSERLEKIEGLSDLESQLTTVLPKLDIELDNGKIDELGLSPEHLQNEKFLLEMGGNVTSVSLDGENYRVFLKGVAGALYRAQNPEALTKALPVGYPKSVALGNVSLVDFGLGLTHISHADQYLAATITGTITAKDVGAVNRKVNDAIDAVQDEIDALDIEGLEIKVGGIGEAMGESFSDMGVAIVIAIAIAYLILVVTMRSILNPLIIMVSLPLASIGALLALLAGGYTLGISGMMGVLMLVGIVLTNAIVLIALVEQLRKGGMNTYDALVEGGRTRLRPILMTALTTMVAMVPLAVGVGEGALIAAELAVVVIGGLFSSTLLTLLVIPVLYSLVEGLRRRRARAS